MVNRAHGGDVEGVESNSFKPLAQVIGVGLILYCLAWDNVVEWVDI